MAFFRFEAPRRVESVLKGEDPNGNLEFIQIDDQGRMRLAADVQADIGDMNLLNTSGSQIDPATEQTVSALLNKTGVTSGQVTDDTSGSTLPANSVPDGSDVTVRGLPGNSSPVLVDGSYPVTAGETVSLSVDDTSKISFTAQTSGDGVAFIVEQ